ncbi:short-chain dehydrogenase [Chitinophagaceae bacterium LB-8]|uniref:Short-chain dehydrogenase n=1 Tax=Paraflavisolibacter caeni TaxID=2982496 RepID=A0A9X3BK00_9BACT|nr:short-chain dehydrogenase [Paraflavisolibacter caeni]MCU7551918.1 short-chain dehydrogenase [Paraflavisolibacter caeni]
MNSEDIQKFLDSKTTETNKYVKISFKNRSPIFGLFVKGHNDYSDLRSKNFWRIVTQSQFDSYNQSKNINLAKIFSGSEFSKLTIHNDSFDL